MADTPKPLDLRQVKAGTRVHWTLPVGQDAYVSFTPLGSEGDWPVLADTHLRDIVSLGGGASGVSVTLTSADLVQALEADTADVTELV